MTINGEECEPVTDFATLGSGMIVWRAPCSFCNGKHRGILGQRMDGLVQSADGQLRLAEFFELLPSAGHMVEGSAVSTFSVSKGNVYRVVDPKLAQTTARKREAVRP